MRECFFFSCLRGTGKEDTEEKFFLVRMKNSYYYTLSVFTYYDLNRLCFYSKMFTWMLRKFVEVTLSQHREKEHRYRQYIVWLAHKRHCCQEVTNHRVSVGSVLFGVRKEIKIKKCCLQKCSWSMDSLWILNINEMKKEVYDSSKNHQDRALKL